MIDSDHWRDVNSVEDLTAAIELYNTLIGLGRYDDAIYLFYSHLQNTLLYRLDASRQQTELLEMLFSDGLDHVPRLSTPQWQAYTFAVLALSLRNQLEPAAVLYRRSIDIYKQEGDQEYITIVLPSLSDVLRFFGAVYESEMAAHRALAIARQLSDQGQGSTSLYWLGTTLAVRGKNSDSEKAFNLSLALAPSSGAYRAYDYQPMRALWFGEYADAQMLANRAMTYCQQVRFERGMIRAARLQGEAALRLGDLLGADERLHHALARARTVNRVEEELPALIGLAELRRRKGDHKAARELLEDVWEAAERGPFRLVHADAFNVLAQIERDAGDHASAVKAATEA